MQIFCQSNIFALFWLSYFIPVTKMEAECSSGLDEGDHILCGSLLSETVLLYLALH